MTKWKIYNEDAVELSLIPKMVTLILPRKDYNTG